MSAGMMAWISSKWQKIHGTIISNVNYLNVKLPSEVNRGTELAPDWKVQVEANKVDTANISKITITDTWALIDIDEDTKFKLRNASLVDILVRTGTNDTDFWTVEPGECFPPSDFDGVKTYQAKVVSGSSVVELISGK